MSVELLQTLSLIAYILAGVFFLLGITLFFLLNVPKLFGDVTGRTAKKAIESIRQKNENSGNKAYKPNQVNATRSKLTDKISDTGTVVGRTSGSGISVGTEKLHTEGLIAKANETTVLTPQSGETTVLVSNSGETTVLSSEEVIESEIKHTTEVTPNLQFTVDVEMSFIGSSEIIE